MDEGRRERFGALYDKTRPRIIAYVMRRTGSPEDAADAVAETFAIAWRHIDDVPDGEEALLWLYVTARGVVANERRRSVRRAQLLSRIAVTLTEHAHGSLDEDRPVALACLRQMSLQDQELLMLSAWEGLDASQLGRAVGCSSTAARVRLHRARRRLETALSQAGVLVSVSPNRGNDPHPDVRCIPEEA